MSTKRSVLVRLRWQKSKRRYEAHFISKLTDCDDENSETDSSLDFAKDYGYISDEVHRKLVNECQEIGRMLGKIINDPKSFLIKQGKSR